MRAPGYLAGPLVIPNVVEVVISWILANDRHASNVLHATSAGGEAATEANATAVMDAISTSDEWVAYAARLAAGTHLMAVKLRSLHEANNVQWVSTSAQADGLGADGALPEEVALCATLKTAHAGRRGRGRIYLPGFDKSACDSIGLALESTRTLAAAWLNQVSAALETNFMSLCVAHRSYVAYTSPATGRVVPEGATLGDIIPADHDAVFVIGFEDGIFDSQRRRK